MATERHAGVVEAHYTTSLPYSKGKDSTAASTLRHSGPLIHSPDPIRSGNGLGTQPKEATFY